MLAYFKSPLYTQELSEKYSDNVSDMDVLINVALNNIQIRSRYYELSQ